MGRGSGENTVASLSTRSAAKNWKVISTSADHHGFLTHVVKDASGNTFSATADEGGWFVPGNPEANLEEPELIEVLQQAGSWELPPAP